LENLRDLVQQASSILDSGLDEKSLWKAYVALESAILQLKLEHGLEHEPSPPRPKRSAKESELISVVKSKLSTLGVDGDKKLLLYNLRICRDALKILLSRASAGQ